MQKKPANKNNSEATPMPSTSKETSVPVLEPIAEESADENVDEASDDETITDIYRMKDVAKPVRWGAPSRNSSMSSDSSGGVCVFGRAAEKITTAEKKQKRMESQKRSKESHARTRLDLLDAWRDKKKSMKGASKSLKKNQRTKKK